MASNPIEQRIELLAEQWEKYKNTDAPVICFRCQPDEVDMIDTFYTYMIADDTEVYDIAFHFDSICSDIQTFSKELLNELTETIEIWNNCQKDERIDFQPVDWKAMDYINSKNNPALLFVENFNRLAKELDLEESLNVVAIFKTHNKTNAFKEWLSHAVKSGIDTNVKFIIDDTTESPFFESLKELKKQFFVLPVKLDMAKAMEQAAAMGDPKDPGTGYRYNFIKMMNAMAQSKEKEAEQLGQTCLKIVEENISKDPYWSIQLVTIYIALANDKLKYKKMAEAFDYASTSVEASIALQQYIDTALATILQAQSQMFRGTLFYTAKKYEEAFTDYQTAFKIYAEQGQTALSIEAARMGAEAAFKAGKQKDGKTTIANGLLQGHLLNKETVLASTYAPLLKMYVDDYDASYDLFISRDEVQSLAKKLYGEDWLAKVKNWNKALTSQEVSSIK